MKKNIACCKWCHQTITRRSNLDWWGEIDDERNVICQKAPHKPRVVFGHSPEDPLIAAVRGANNDL